VVKEIKVIACRVMEDEILNVTGKEHDISFIQYDYHDYPERLRTKIQDEIDRAVDYRYIILCFGLCGGATDGIRANSCPVIIPKTDDCISLFLGSKEKYDQLRKREGGTFFLTQGWIKYGNDALKDYQKWQIRYGEQKASWLIKEIYKAYTRVSLIKHSFTDTTSCSLYAEQLATFLGISMDTLLGDLDMFRRLFSNEWDDDFIQLQPGQQTERGMFRD
jgi:hypothetical protein